MKKTHGNLVKICYFLNMIKVPSTRTNATFRRWLISQLMHLFVSTTKIKKVNQKQVAKSEMDISRLSMNNVLNVSQQQGAS